MSSSMIVRAVGDISFEGSEADKPSMDYFRDVASVFRQSELVVANLECVLVTDGIPIRGKCTLRGSPGWATVMKSAGIDLVSLANNHVMDYGVNGLLGTIEALRRAGIRYVGAGRNRREACAPLFLDVAGKRLAFLARSSVPVNAPTYAGETSPGVASLDAEETAAAIRACRAQADFVILLVHWGLEEYSYPSPSQRQLARRFADAGADVIVGHHPHVLQGVEHYGAALIVYSLGNFVFNEFEWTAIIDSAAVKQADTLSPENRKGMIVGIHWAGDKGPHVMATPTRIGDRGRVSVDSDTARQREWEALSARVHRRGYWLWWQLYAIRREWSLRIGHQLSLRRIVSNLHRIRPHHISALLGSLRRSARIVTEKTTNPYD